MKLLTASAGLEEKLRSDGYSVICGVDEAGRGCIAGPVVAASVVLDEKIEGIADSKMLSPKKREMLFLQIIRKCRAFGVGIVDVDEIETHNILQATKKAVVRSVSLLKLRPEILLLDALSVPELNMEQMSFVKGDRDVYSISAASIIAKVIRDRLMIRYDSIYPGYGLKKHKGYCTRSHVSSIRQNGITPIHRKSFEPIKGMLTESLFDR